MTQVLTRSAVRRLVTCFAIASMLLHGLSGCGEVIDGPYGLGRKTGLLSTGQLAVVAGEFRAGPSGEAIRPTGRTDYKSVMYDWGSTPEGKYTVSSGTTCVVEIDPAWDEDSASEGRPIAVKLSDGEHRGKSVAIPRRLLRKR